MLKVNKKNKGQNTAEYAILIALVIGAIIAMQTYAQRGFQARMRGTSLYMKDQMGAALANARSSNPSLPGSLNSTAQYEPYYASSSYNVDKDSTEDAIASPNRIGRDLTSNRTRQSGGYEATTYNAAVGAATQD